MNISEAIDYLVSEGLTPHNYRRTFEIRGLFRCPFCGNKVEIKELEEYAREKNSFSIICETRNCILYGAKINGGGEGIIGKEGLRMQWNTRKGEK